MNNCESDRVKVWRVLRQSNDELLQQYTSIYNKLNELLNQLILCCEDKNDLLQQILNQLDVLIQNLIDCCEAITGRLDIIIDILIDPIPESLIGYVVEWKDHICEEEDGDIPPESWEIEYEDHICQEVEPPIPDEYWYVEFEDHICEEVTDIGDAFIVEWEDHICQQADDIEWPLIGYELEYTDHICQEDWECDVTGHLVDISENEVIIDYGGQWIDYTCVIEIEHVTTTTTEDTAVTTTTTPAGTTTTTTEEVVVTTTTEEPTTTTTTPMAPTTDYGYLYNWYAAIGDTDGNFVSDKNIANTGWHVPAQTEWNTLITYIGGSATGGRELKSTGTTYWDLSGGLDNYGFDARGGGQRILAYDNFKTIGTWWASTLVTTQFKTARFNSCQHSTDTMTQSGSAGMFEGKSLRLIKDSTSLNDGETGTYLGNNGVLYPTICIGTQEWLSKDLEETEFRDGTSIPYVDNQTAADDTEWAGKTTAAYCIYPIV